MRERRNPEDRTFTVEQLGRFTTTVNGNSFLECKTTLGVVAFWCGKANQTNIQRLKELPLPATIRVGCILPSSGFRSSHALWVPESSTFETLTGAGTTHAAVPGGEPEQKLVAVEELADFRREILRVLNALDPVGRVDPSEGIGARITRLTHEGKIPRPIAAMMKAITEMRNAAEYEGIDPTKAQSRAVLENRTAVIEWARSQKLAD